jgi:hypothetical protein
MGAAVLIGCLGAGGLQAQPETQEGREISMPTGRIKGQVVDEAGQLIPLTRRTLKGHLTTAGGVGIVDKTLLPTDGIRITPLGGPIMGNGSFTFTGQYAGRYTIRVRVNGYLPQTREVVLEPGQETAFVKFVLKRGNCVEGVVVDEAGRPVPGTQMSIHSALTGLRAPVNVKEHFDEKGNFHYPLPPGRYTLHVAATGYTPQTRAVTVKENGIATAKFVLKKATP